MVAPCPSRSTRHEHLCEEPKGPAIVYARLRYSLLRSIDQADKMLNDAGVALYKLPEEIAGAPAIRHRGRYWSPATLSFQLSP